jgi:hypothetical protein
VLVNHSDIQRRFLSLAPFLDERMRRLVAASESEAIGYGGVSVVARATGVSRRAITDGVKELKRPKSAKARLEESRIRRRGAGRKRMMDKDSSLLEDLDRLVDPVTRGDRNHRCAGRARVCADWRRNSSMKAIPSVIRLCSCGVADDPRSVDFGWAALRQAARNVRPDCFG